MGKCVIINGQSCREVGSARAADRARIADLERDLASALAQIVEVERIFGNAAVFDAAHGDIVEKARIAYRGGVESQRLAARLAEVERENAECCAADLKTLLERDHAVKARDAALARVAEVERAKDEEVQRLCSLVNHEMADAERWQRQATEQVQEIIRLKTEHDDARRVAKLIAQVGRDGCCAGAERDEFDAAVRTALAYEVKPHASVDAEATPEPVAP